MADIWQAWNSSVDQVRTLEIVVLRGYDKAPDGIRSPPRREPDVVRSRESIPAGIGGMPEKSVDPSRVERNGTERSGTERR